MFLLATAPMVSGCGDETARRGSSGPDVPAAGDPLFTRLSSRQTGVRFENRLRDSRELNVFTYRNFYNGGGVALGDLNGDYLPELVLTSNLEGPRLYLNQGGFRFRDVTREAGLESRGGWSTGVALADVNGDGLLDIYLCRAGDVEPDRRANTLYVHQGLGADGIPRFVERAAAFGVADQGYSTHAAFVDYDRDGDLDLYVVNNAFRPISTLGLENIRQVRDSLGGDRLYRNTGGHFVDVSEEAGIFGSVIGFGLGVAVGDINRDGWPDLYVANDFFERDYLYLNRGDGTFAEVLEQQMPSISYSSMGLDLADINNDGWLDLFVADMLPADDRRLKLTTSFESWELYQLKLKHGYHHQLTRNTLQLNNGNGTFSEIGQLAGVARTDWSWSVLLADFDLDGYKDLHVTNGIPRDVTGQDYLTFLSSSETMAAAVRGRRVDFLLLVEAMTSTPLPDYAFRNRGDLTFHDQSAAWGLNTPGFSNGSAYGDLDGDGDLDLVVNAINQEALLYRNNARARLPHRYLQVLLEGTGANRFGIGARVSLWGGGRIFVQEMMPSRGFQSSVDYILTFGVGDIVTLDSVTVEWPDGRVSSLRAVASNQRLTVRQADAAATSLPAPRSPIPLFTDVSERIRLPFTHRENAFVDFEREPLMPKLLSTEGPPLAVADVDRDGWDDVFLGGARDQPGALLLQRGGAFTSSQPNVFEPDRVSEDVGAVFFDANGDGWPDLYVVSGGNEFADMAPALQDRLYLNDGRGRLRPASDHLPPEHASGSRVVADDFDGDGDHDLFVGGRAIPWAYGLDPRSLLLANDGSGRFADVAERVAPGLARVGMVTDALWQDVDGDHRLDLVLVGEWMPITIFRQTGNGAFERWRVPGLERTHGWWNRIVAGDFTGDGRVDFVVGNLGLNTRLRADPQAPAIMHVKDLNGNDYVEQIVSLTSEGVSRPLVLRDALVRAVPDFATRFATAEDYARQTTADLLATRSGEAVVKTAYTFATMLVRNDGAGAFTPLPLPLAAQIAPVYAMHAADVDGDGNLDLLLAGNFDGVRPEIGRMRASYGLLLRGDGRGGFHPIPGRDSGFVLPGQARDIRVVRTPHGPLYVVARNNEGPVVFRAAAGQ